MVHHSVITHQDFEEHFASIAINLTEIPYLSISVEKTPQHGDGDSLNHFAVCSFILQQERKDDFFFGKFIGAARIIVLPFTVMTHYQQFCAVTVECQRLAAQAPCLGRKQLISIHFP